VLIAPKKPTAPHTSAIVPATPMVTVFPRKASSCLVMKSNCVGK